MLQKIPKHFLYTSSHGWLASTFLFSFAEYYDPRNIEWGSLRVYNDDTIAPHSGFPMHSHLEMEIVTIMLTGTLTHNDSLGNTRQIRKGDVQYMSAGTGVTHSEMNTGDSPVNLYQLWFYPIEACIAPHYQEHTYDHMEEKGLHLLMSPDGRNGSIKANTNSLLLYGNLLKGGTHTRELRADEYVLIYIRKGELMVGEEVLQVGDQLRIHNETLLSYTVQKECEFILIISSV